MLQKVIQVGNSLALTIPKSFIDKTGFKAGDEIFVHQDPESKSLIVTAKESYHRINLSPDLFAWLSDVKDKYSDAIKDLAKK